VSSAGLSKLRLGLAWVNRGGGAAQLVRGLTWWSAGGAVGHRRSVYGHDCLRRAWARLAGEGLGVQGTHGFGVVGCPAAGREVVDGVRMRHFPVGESVPSTRRPAVKEGGCAPQLGEQSDWPGAAKVIVNDRGSLLRSGVLPTAWHERCVRALRERCSSYLRPCTEYQTTHLKATRWLPSR
jgi:hypothetical protein